MEANGNKVTSHVVKGLILAGVLIVYSIIGHLAHLIQSDWFFLVGIFIFVVSVIVSVINYSTQMNGNINFSNLLAYGLKLTAVVTCIFFLYSLLEVYVLFPSYIDETVKSWVQRASKNGKIDEESYAANKEQAHKVLTTLRFAGMVMLTMIIGLLASLVGGALAKKNPGASIVQQ